MMIQLRWLVRLVLILLLFALLFLLVRLSNFWMPVFHLLWMVATPFLLAGFISYLLQPIVAFFEKRKLKRTLVLLGVFLVFFASLGFAIYKGVPLLLHQLQELIDNLPELLKPYQLFFNRMDDEMESLPFGLNEGIQKFLDNQQHLLTGDLLRSPNLLVEVSKLFYLLTLTPFITFYFLKDHVEIKDWMIGLVPSQWQSKVRTFFREIDQALGSYIRGQLLICFLIGLASALLFWLVGMKYPLLLGLVIGITDIIPYFGPILGAIPALIAALFVSKAMVLKVALVIVVLQFLEGNVLAPVVMGKVLRLHPLAIILALIVGEKLGGVLGLIIAVPIFAFVKILVTHIRLHTLTK